MYSRVLLAMDIETKGMRVDVETALDFGGVSRYVQSRTLRSGDL